MLPLIDMWATSPEVGNVQRFLNSTIYRDWSGKPLVVDENFGQRSVYVLRQWQTANMLNPSGVFDELARSRAKSQGFVPFVQAKNFTQVYPRVRKIDLLIVHTMEASEKPGTADAVAAWFAGPSAPKASAHYCIDPASIVQCVRDMDVAWQAPGANNNGIGIEHGGFAKQTPAEWSDDASRRILQRSAKLCAQLCALYQIPLLRPTAEGLRQGQRGIVGHHDVSTAFGGTHWDPGPGFDFAGFFDLIRPMLPA